MFSLVHCQSDSFWGRCFFKASQNDPIQILGESIHSISLSRPNRLPARKLLSLVEPAPVLLSSKIPIKERQRLSAAGIKLFSLEQKGMNTFSLLLCLNTAIQLFSLSGIPFPCQILGIIDPDFQYADLTERALRHLTQVRIFTQNLPAAEEFARKMMAEYGAPVSYSDNETILNTSGLIFSPASILPHCTVPVILPHKPDTESQGILFHSPTPILPSALAETIPDDISTLELLSALYTLEHCRILSKTESKEICFVCPQFTSEIERYSLTAPSSLTPYEASGLLLHHFQQQKETVN